MNDHYIVNLPSVVSEIIDGEAVILNLKSGNYYSSDKCGAELWAWIEQGHSPSKLVELMQQHYSGDTEAMKRAVTRFLDELLEQELVRTLEPQSVVAGTPSTADEIPNARRPFEAPVLQIHKDMQDLFLLDPIHDVDDVGWPSAKQAGAHVEAPSWPTANADQSGDIR